MTEAANVVAGALEELDGTPIRPTVPPRPEPWARAVVSASVAVLGRPALWAVALVPFLARGGVLLLLLPALVLPSFVGLATFVGPTSVTAEGPGPHLVAILIAALGAGIALAIAGTLVAAAGEATLLLSMSRPGRAGSSGGRPHATIFVPEVGPVSDAVADWRGATIRGATIRVAAVRLLLLVPMVALGASAVPAWVAAAYRELTLPSDVAMPLLLRVVAGSTGPTIVVAVAWLAGEVVGGFATRRTVLLGTPWPRALAAALEDPIRAPLGTALAVAVAILVSVVLLVPSGWAIGAAWAASRDVLAEATNALAVLAVSLLVSAAWAIALVLAGIAAAWRAALASAELLRRHPVPR